MLDAQDPFAQDPFAQIPARADDAEARFRAEAAKRILVLDGAMGTEVQLLKLEESHFRGERFVGCECHLQGNNDLLTLTQPEAIEAIHFSYAQAGADILETNTFSSTRIAQADYGMEEVVYELNRDGARLAKRAAQKAEQLDGRPRFVAGALGPTNRTASMSPDVNNPGFRAISFDELREAYAEQLVAAFPDQRFVIDHMAKPHIKEGVISEWRRALRKFAGHQQVYCKISGMVNEADWEFWEWEDFRPYMDAVVETFGTKRIMYGSDWPVCLLAADYDDVKDIVEDYFYSFTTTEQADFFGNNVKRFYQLV